MKEIERKIMENRLGRPEPKTAERVPKWDREQVGYKIFLLLELMAIRIYYPKIRLA